MRLHAIHLDRVARCLALGALGLLVAAGAGCAKSPDTEHRAEHRALPPTVASHVVSLRVTGMT